MIKWLKYTTIFFLFLSTYSVLAQTDSVNHTQPQIRLKADTNVLFQTKKPEVEPQKSTSKMEIDVYLSSYYSYYTEDNTGAFIKYPTMAARNRQFGLNMAMISFSYHSEKVRSVATLHYGDIAESVWPKTFNMVQEANAGVQIIKKLWFDAGIFRSHIGLESTQPRENITSSMSLVNVYEPYYFSGAKLTYLLSPKLSVQINAFNSFNSITETNTNKLFGGSVVYSPNNYISITYNFITGDDTPDTSFIKHQRYYHNLYGTYQKKKITIAAEFNYGIQDYSKYKNAYTLTTAYMNSCLLLLRHQSFKKIAFYGRGEWFSDEDEILSSGSGMGKYTWGATAGIEYKPLKNTAISLEGRYLESEKANFMYNGNLRKDRLEAILCVDAWF